MADHKGDPAKQPQECNVNVNNRCSNLKNTYSGWDSETYSCEVCGEHYHLYDDEMR